jgi:hypothetical protein
MVTGETAGEKGDSVEQSIMSQYDDQSCEHRKVRIESIQPSVSARR